MSSEGVHLDRDGISVSSRVAPLTQGPNMDQPGASIMLPTDHPINNADSIEFVALQERGADPKMIDEETHEARIERLGRQRPEKFKTLWAEIGFVFSIVMSQVMTVSLLSIVIETSHLYSANRARMIPLSFVEHPIVDEHPPLVMPLGLKHVPLYS
jgi:hypothetical protein